MKTLIHLLLYRSLSLEHYLRVVSRLFFWTTALGIGRHSAATEYNYHLKKLVKKGDTALDIGANLGYYARKISRLIGTTGHLYAIEPVPLIFKVLQHNMKGCKNVDLMPYALGEEEKTITMGNDTVAQNGYFGTGQNFVREPQPSTTPKGMSATAEMKRGSQLFSSLCKLDFIKCDIEGYEWIVMQEMRPLLERFHPTVLIETGGENRPRIIQLFEGLGYKGFILQHGEEIPLPPSGEKDIIFRYTNH